MMSKKIAIVTGGSKGIGAAVIDNFIKNDYQAYNISRSVNKTIRSEHNYCFDLETEITFAEINDRFSGIPDRAEICLIHNAFPYYKDNIDDFSSDKFLDSVRFTILNTITLTRFFLKRMAKKSSVIFIGSTLSERSAENCLTYTLLKHAQLGLMRSMTQDLAEQDLHTCAICPGFTDTSMLGTHLTKDSIKEVIDNVVVKKRILSPEEIADFVYKCAITPIVNGQVFHVNLGQK